LLVGILKRRKSKDGDGIEEIGIKIEVCVFFGLLWDLLRGVARNSVIV
jgi:hypothetical protein